MEKLMTKVKVAGFGVSLDGFAAGTTQSLGHPLGLRGEEVFQWFFPTRTFRQMLGKEGGETGLETGSPDAQWKVSVPSSSVATCSDLFVGNGLTINGKAGGAIIRLIMRQLSC